MAKSVIIALGEPNKAFQNPIKFIEEQCDRAGMRPRPGTSYTSITKIKRDQQKRKIQEREERKKRSRLARLNKFLKPKPSLDKDELIKRKPKKSTLCGRFYNWLVIKTLFFFFFGFNLIFNFFRMRQMIYRW